MFLGYEEIDGKIFAVSKNLTDNVVNFEGQLPIFIFTDKVEEGAFEQAIHLAKLPFAFHHVALMPDVHQGYGMPIGGVLATQKYIIPNAVGVDIGCGMRVCRVKGIKASDIPKETLIKIREDILNDIPVGMNWHEAPLYPDYVPPLTKNLPVVESQYETSQLYMGTLGGGNHFIELQRDDEDNLYIMIHSGSRNLGKKVCDHYSAIAKKLNEQYFSSVPSNWDLAFLPFDSDVGRLYFEEMKFCTEFARKNRECMMIIIQEILFRYWTNIGFVDEYDVHHNYAAFEHHFGKNVIVHRKGATRANKDEIGIIPGSQGTSSYLVVGKGNPRSFRSCSHGAGRVMGRREAQRKLSLEEEQKRLDSLGIVHNLNTIDSLDEAPSAYKNIDEVMERQKDLVDIKTKLHPILVIKE